MVASPAPFPHRVPAADMEWVHSAATRGDEGWGASSTVRKTLTSLKNGQLLNQRSQTVILFPLLQRQSSSKLHHRCKKGSLPGDLFWVHIQFWLLEVCTQSNSNDISCGLYSSTHTILKFGFVIFIWGSVSKAKKLLINLANIQVSFWGYHSSDSSKIQ